MNWLRKSISRLIPYAAFASIIGVISYATVPAEQVCGNFSVVRGGSGPPCRWEVASLTYYDDFVFPGLDGDRSRQVRDQAYADIAASCGLSFRRVDSPKQANLAAYVVPLPPPTAGLAVVACNARGTDSVWQNYTSSYTWDERTAYLVSLHEIGHNLGLDHDMDPTSIMQPKVNTSLANLGFTDVLQLQLRYGFPGSLPPPAPPAPPVPIPPTPVPEPMPSVTTFLAKIGDTPVVTLARIGDSAIGRFTVPPGPIRRVTIRTFGQVGVELSVRSKRRELGRTTKGAPDKRNPLLVLNLAPGDYEVRLDCKGKPGFLTLSIKSP